MDEWIGVYLSSSMYLPLLLSSKGLNFCGWDNDINNHRIIIRPSTIFVVFLEVAVEEEIAAVSLSVLKERMDDR